MENHAPKRWQNLIFGKCPKCDNRLEIRHDKATFYECETEGCGFMITDRAYVEILMDENHIMREFLTTHERQVLKQAIGSLRDARPEVINR